MGTADYWKIPLVAPKRSCKISSHLSSPFFRWEDRTRAAGLRRSSFMGSDSERGSPDPALVGWNTDRWRRAGSRGMSGQSSQPSAGTALVPSCPRQTVATHSPAGVGPWPRLSLRVGSTSRTGKSVWGRWSCPQEASQQHSLSRSHILRRIRRFCLFHTKKLQRN